MADVLLPQLGETVTEGTITRWFFGVGETVPADAPLYEVSTEKVDSEVPSPLGGVLVEIIAPEGATVAVGALLCRIEPADYSSVAPASASATPTVADDAPTDAAGATSSVGTPPTPAGTGGPTATREVGLQGGRASGRLLSPVVRRLLAEHGLDPARVSGTGLGGRLTRRDVEQFLRDNPGRAEPFNGIRKATARHMVGSKATSPHVLTAMEVDFDAVDRLRSAEKDVWRAAEGSSLTYLPFLVRALAGAIAEYPKVNSSVVEGELVIHRDVNLAVAVDLDFEGLVVPVVHKVGDLSLTDTARALVEIARRARAGELVPNDMAGGTFTVTNPGSYRTLLSFPIINQPQVAILSTDGVQRKPAVVLDDAGEETVAVRSIGVLGLAWDHRPFDGAYAVVSGQGIILKRGHELDQVLKLFDKKRHLSVVGD